MTQNIKSFVNRINPRSPKFIITGVLVLLVLFFIFLILQAVSPKQRQIVTKIETPVPTPTLTPGKDFVKGQIVVKFRDGLSISAINKELSKYNASIKSQNGAIRSTVVSVPAGQEDTVRKALTKDGFVKYAEPNYIMHVQFDPNDTDFSDQWGFSNTGQNIKGQTGTSNDDIHIRQAWDITKGNGVKVAVLDTGIDLNHPEFAGKIAIQKVFATDSNGNLLGIDDKYGHGTHTAGIVGADTNNSQGVAGTCPDCQLMIVKVLDDSASGPYATIAQGITFATDNGAKVISMSLAGQDYSQELQDAVNYAWGKGVVVVAAAGNCGDANFNLNGCNNQNPKEYPGALNNVVSVAATDNNNQRASFSNNGTWVTIAAPGKYIFSTLPTHSYAMQSSHKTALNYDFLSGTSMAAPMVSGVAALIWSTPYGSSNQAVVNRLLSTANPITGTGTLWQNGLLNAQAAVAPQSAVPTPTTPAPTFVCEGSPNNVCNPPTATPTTGITIIPTATSTPTPTTTEITPGTTITPIGSPTATLTPLPNPNTCSNQNEFLQNFMNWLRAYISYIFQFIQNILNNPRQHVRFQRPNPPIPCTSTNGGGLNGGGGGSNGGGSTGPSGGSNITN